MTGSDIDSKCYLIAATLRMGFPDGGDDEEAQP